MDICVYTFWLLWLIVLWIFVFKFSCGCMFSFLSGVYLGVELLDHMGTLCNLLRNCHTAFQSSYTILHFLPAMSKGSLPTLIIICIFYYSHPSWPPLNLKSHIFVLIIVTCVFLHLIMVIHAWLSTSCNSLCAHMIFFTHGFVPPLLPILLNSRQGLVAHLGYSTAYSCK